MTRSTSTKKIQKNLLELLKSFDLLCRLNGIDYSLHGGTLLGAVRNQGFIEWDDDADVAMTRKNFDQLLALLREDPQCSNFKLDTSTSQRPMLWSVNNDIPVWIDIFVYDYISENQIAKTFKLSLSVLFLAFTKTEKTMKVFRQGSHGQGFSRFFVESLYLLGLLFPMKGKIKLANHIFSHFFNGSGKLIFRSNDQYLGIKKVIPSTSMSSYCRLPFEDTDLQVSTDWHGILTSCYGQDYMVPKKEKTVVLEAHNIYRSFNKPNEK